MDSGLSTSPGPGISPLLALGLVLVVIVAYWKTFGKSHYRGGVCLIPIYNVVVWLDLAGKPWWWLFLLLIPGVNLLLWVVIWVDFARAYDQGTGFGVGLAIPPLNFLLMLILAFGSAEYVGAGYRPGTVRVPGQPAYAATPVRKRQPQPNRTPGGYVRVGTMMRDHAEPARQARDQPRAEPFFEVERPGGEAVKERPPTPTPTPAAKPATASTRDSFVNQQIGHYYIQQRLQSGGMAVVYRAYDQHRKLLVAFKVLRENYADQPQIVLRFRREAEIAQQLAHPHIVPFYDFGEVDGNLYMVLKFMEAGSLSDRLSRTANVTLGKTARWLRQVSSALDFAHNKGIIHRDLKPGNILLANDDDAYLSDFGIARITEATQLTMTGQSMPGTARYMSPEQAMGDPRLDHRSDIYSFGVIAYLLATGRYPFTGSTEHVIINQHIHNLPPRPTEVNPSLPPALDDVLNQCLAKDPSQRCASATQFVNTFERAIAGYEDLMVIVDPSAANPISSTASARPYTPTPTPTPTPPAPGFDVHTAITQFYQAYGGADWGRARTLLTEIRRSGQVPQVFDLQRAGQMLQDASNQSFPTAEAEREYAILRVMAQHETPERVWQALQTFWERFPGYDPDGLARRFRPA